MPRQSSCCIEESTILAGHIGISAVTTEDRGEIELVQYSFLVNADDDGLGFIIHVEFVRTDGRRQAETTLCIQCRAWKFCARCRAD